MTETPDTDRKRGVVAAALRLTLAAKRPRRASEAPRMTMPALRLRRVGKKGAVK